MTNGEKIKEIFPHIQIFDIVENEQQEKFIHIRLEDVCQAIELDWWNAEYKEPTTKNEAKYCDRSICLRNEYNNIGCDDCEVTKSQEPTTKNNLGVDAISREQALNEFCIYNPYDSIGVDKVRSSLKALPSVTPQEQQTFKWCTTCKEYDQEKHCCHRWSKVIRDTVEEMKQEPRKNYISIDDVMSVFDDFMCDEVDEDSMEIFLEMLKDKAESEDKE